VSCVSNPRVPNTRVSNPRVSNPRVSNPRVSNTRVPNTRVSNPRVSNTRVRNTRVRNTSVSNTIFTSDVSRGSTIITACDLFGVRSILIPCDVSSTATPSPSVMPLERVTSSSPEAAQQRGAAGYDGLHRARRLVVEAHLLPRARLQQHPRPGHHHHHHHQR